MQYTIRHITRFNYMGPVRESAMEVRLQPRSDRRQTCYSFELRVDPNARVNSYVDDRGNVVHFFDIAASHETLYLESRALVDVSDPVVVGERTPGESWADLDAAVEQGDFWDDLNPSHFIQETDLLVQLAREVGAVRRDSPIALVRELSSRIYSGFEYRPLSTHANSPIDDALQDRAGVCQDFAHIFIALVRRLGIPGRYVSGYLFHRSEEEDRSAEDASHAWAEVFLPSVGWLGIDPTNNIVAGERHIVVAVGRDYADVPPTKGVFKGIGASELQVGVRVAPAKSEDATDSTLKLATMPQTATPEQTAAFEQYQQQQ